MIVVRVGGRLGLIPPNTMIAHQLQGKVELEDKILRDHRRNHIRKNLAQLCCDLERMKPRWPFSWSLESQMHVHAKRLKLATMTAIVQLIGP